MRDGINQKIFLGNDTNTVFLKLEEFKFQGAGPLVVTHQRMKLGNFLGIQRGK